MDRKTLVAYGKATALLAVAVVAIWMLPPQAADSVVEQGAVVESVAAPTVESTADQSQGAESEGIHVRGHWTIEVRDPDGTLASRTEFENSLTGVGVTFMTMWIGRTRTVGAWTVAVDATVGTKPCATAAGAGAACFMQEAATPTGGATNHFPTLTVNGVPALISDPTAGMALTGTATAAADATINRVFTQARPCASSASPDDCASGVAPGVDLGAVFTSAILASPVAVVTGQSILVTVVISFS